MKEFFKNLAIRLLVLLFCGGVFLVYFNFLATEAQVESITKIYEELKYECVTIYKNVSNFVSDKVEDFKKFFNKTPKFDGLKIREIDDFEIAEYINFTIPYDWNLTTMALNESKKATVIYNDSAMAIMYLQDVSINKDTKILNWYRDELIEAMKDKYPNYTFSNGKTLKRSIALIEVNSNSVESKMNIAIVGVKEKTVIIEFMYSQEEANEYFNFIIDEIKDCV